MLTALSNFGAWLLPRSCALCGDPIPRGGKHVCDPCLAAMPRMESKCPRCAMPTSGGDVCGACLTHPPAFDATFCAYRYAFPLSRLIQDFKYGKKLALTHTLASLLADGIPAHFHENCDAVVAMPLAKNRQVERGFNQAHELARVTARALHLPLLTHTLVRTKEAPKQATLSLKERRKNVKNAFLCNAPLRHKRLLLIDDVITTGSTASAAAAALHKAGAGAVTLAVVARSV